MTARPNVPRPYAPTARAPRAPESTGKLDSAETNPLPHVSSAKAWTSLEADAKRASRPSFPLLPKATPIIRDKAPTPARYIRADGTEEIRASDIMIVVPKATAPTARRAAPLRPRANSTGEIDAGDILSAEPAAEDIQVEVEAPVFRPPAFSIHATQEILADDVLEVQAAAAQLPAPAVAPQQFLLQLPASLAAPQPQAQPQPGGREEAPSAPPPPWTIDSGAADEFEFPTQLPVMSGPYSALSSGPRLTSFSATEVFRRRSHGMKLVVASVTFAAAVMAVAGVAKVSPSLGSDGPVGIELHKPMSLDRSVRTRDRIVGFSSRTAADTVTVSIDDLAPVHRRH
ncbi:MAG TPA: hypothetical protein VLM85_00840 [Polyangiaceae bacterium]|nr:hypothetical protein [Polyangiaceae bacterium]